MGREHWVLDWKAWVHFLVMLSAHCDNELLEAISIAGRLKPKNFAKIHIPNMDSIQTAIQRSDNYDG